MKFTKQALETAIEYVYPQAKIMKENKVYTNNVDWVKNVAEHYFLEQAFNEDARDLKIQEAYYICQDALKSLHQYGEFRYGVKGVHYLEEN